MARAEEIAAMRRAIALSAAGMATTSPNPPVGCVVLRPDGQIAGEGYHERKGEAHAEGNALAAAGKWAAGGTAVVSLEPCNHEGRAPACSRLLMGARVARVVIGVLDPTSRDGGGAARLRESGVNVEVGVLTDEAMVVLGPWLAALDSRRPMITLAYVAAGDGMATLPADLGEARLLRLDSDAVLHADGSVIEAVPGSHGAGMLRLSGFGADEDCGAVAASIYAGGVRRLLLDGSSAWTQPFLDLGLVDRVFAYLPDGGASRTADTAAPDVLPPGFSIVAVARLDGFVRVEGRRVGIKAER